MNYSNEQKAIAEQLQHTNILVDAVAGSGKTTTIGLLVKKYPNLHFTILCYSKALQDDTEKKITSTNALIKTIHASVGYFFGGVCNTDKAFDGINKKKLIRSFNTDVLVLDELQDFTELYYKYICHLIQNHSDISKLKLVCLGDYMQNIFKFNGADFRYLTMANQMFPVKGEWKEMNLSTTYRVPSNICRFINYVMLGRNRMIPSRLGGDVYYKIVDKWNFDLLNLLESIKKQGYMNDDIYILVKTIPKNLNAPINKCINQLSKNKDILFEVTESEKPLEAQLMKNKVVVSTFHKVKGLERKVVIIFGFDNSYNYGKETKEIESECPSVHYVASTRSLEKLYLIHLSGECFLPYLKHTGNALSRFCNYENNSDSGPTLNDMNIKFRIYTVSDLLRFIPYSEMKLLMQDTHREQINKPLMNISLPTTIKSNNIYEDVSDINGYAIPLWYWLKLCNNDIKTFCSEILKNHLMDTTNSTQLFSDEDKIKIASINTINVHNVLYLACVLTCMNSRLNHRLRQINSFDWLEEQILEKAAHTLFDLIGVVDYFEMPIETAINIDEYGCSVFGMIDGIKNKNIWEFKSVKEIRDEHILQVCLYKWLCNQNSLEMNDMFYIINTLTGEILAITNTNINLMAINLLRFKNSTPQSKPDIEFLKSSLK